MCLLSKGEVRRFSVPPSGCAGWQDFGGHVVPNVRVTGAIQPTHAALAEQRDV
jgi:hypothetical protein